MRYNAGTDIIIRWMFENRLLQGLSQLIDGMICIHTQRESSYITPYMERQSLSVGEYQGLMLKVSYNWGNKKVKNGKKHNPISENQRERYSGNK